MLYSLMPGVCVVTDSRSNPGHLVDCDTNAYPRSADENAAIRDACHELRSDELRKIRIVGRHFVTCPKVMHLVSKLHNKAS